MGYALATQEVFGNNEEVLVTEEETRIVDLTAFLSKGFGNAQMIRLESPLSQNMVADLNNPAVVHLPGTPLTIYFGNHPARGNMIVALNSMGTSYALVERPVEIVSIIPE